MSTTTERTSGVGGRRRRPKPPASPPRRPATAPRRRRPRSRPRARTSVRAQIGRDMLEGWSTQSEAVLKTRIRGTERRGRCRAGPVRPRPQGQSAGRRAVLRRSSSERRRRRSRAGSPPSRRPDGDRTHQALTSGSTTHRGGRRSAGHLGSVSAGSRRFGMADLTGKSCFVTGGSSGIGREIALELGRHGGYRGRRLSPDDKGHDREAEANEVAAEIAAAGGQAYAIGCDVSDPASIDTAIASVVERCGTVDVLVNNAGITRDRSLAKMSRDEWDSVIDTNLSSVFHVTAAGAAAYGPGSATAASSTSAPSSGCTATSARPTMPRRRRGSSASRRPRRSSSPARA